MRKQGITHDHELEKAVLGAILVEGAEAFVKVQGILKPDVFDHTAHGMIYDVVKSIFEQGQPIDMVTISAKLRGNRQFSELTDGQPAYYIANLTSGVIGSAHLEEWAKILFQLYITRELPKTIYSLPDDPFDAIVELKNRADSLLDVSYVDSWASITDVSQKLVNKIETIQSNRGAVFTRTGIHFVDSINGGFKSPQMIVIAARPSVGKSALAGNIVIKAAEQGKRIGIINMEMDNEDTLARMLSAAAQIDNYKLELGTLNNEADKQILLKGIEKFSQYNIMFSDRTRLNINDIRAKAMKLAKKGGLDLLVVDYIQLLEGSGNAKRHEQIMNISRGIKGLAKELRIPIIVLSQLNREGSSVANLSGSDAIGADADVVIIIERPFETMDVDGIKVSNATLKIEKFRNGATGIQECWYDGNRLKFVCKEHWNDYIIERKGVQPKIGFGNGLQNNNLDF